MALSDLSSVERNEEGILAVLGILKQRFGERFQTGQAIRAQHAHTTTYIPTQAPDGVAFPETTQEVQEIVRACAAHRVPVIAFGVGSSLEGHVNAPGGGISLDMARMNRVLAVHAQDLDCTVEPGVTREDLNQYLRDTGLFFPIDPGANASLGGMAATRASGTNAVRYGTMKDNVLALKVVLPNGELMTTARRAKKTSSGYDLTRLMIGSEGTLGVITELTLKLHGIPEAISGGVCPFPSVEACCNTAIQTIQTGIPIARIELLDALQVRAVNLHSKLGLPETPLLFLEFHGTEASVAEQSVRFGEIAAEFGGGPFQWTTKQEERTKLWDARHHAAFSNFALRPGSQMVATDVCVPISRLAECVTQTQADIAESRLVAPIVGHIGDGNFHLTMLIDRDDPDEVARAKALHERLVQRALSMDGTCTGEHGVGQGKKHFMVAEHGAPAVELMRALKRAIDPQDIMNPGKLV
jgi:D-lactate dehydrogenase (cytochrome)